MSAEIKNGNLVITLPLQTPTMSKTGKSLIVAGTNGFAVTNARVNNTPVKISVNAIIQPQAAAA